MIPDLPRGTSQTPSSRVSDYADWLTKAQAADRIGVSTKAIERFAQAGKLQQAFRPTKGSPDVRVYHPADVDRLAQERAPAPLAPFLVPGPASVPSNGNGQAGLSRANPSDVGLGGDASPDLLRVLVTAAMQVLSETSQTPQPYEYLTIKEAAAACRLTQAYVRRRCEDGSLKAVKDRGWKIRRKDLEQL